MKTHTLSKSQMRIAPLLPPLKRVAAFAIPHSNEQAAGVIALAQMSGSMRWESGMHRDFAELAACSRSRTVLFADHLDLDLGGARAREEG